MRSLFSLIPAVSELDVVILAGYKLKEVAYCGGAHSTANPADGINKIMIADGRRHRRAKRAFVYEQPASASPSPH
jgi:hypothetical protein